MAHDTEIFVYGSLMLPHNKKGFEYTYVTDTAKSISGHYDDIKEIAENLAKSINLKPKHWRHLIHIHCEPLHDIELRMTLYVHSPLSPTEKEELGKLLAQYIDF